MAFANNPCWKTYGGTVTLPKRHRYATSTYGQVRCVVYTTSMSAVVQALNIRGTRETLNHVITHWSVTGNEYECTVAKAKPGVPFIGPMNESPGETRPYKPYMEWL